MHTTTPVATVSSLMTTLNCDAGQHLHPKRWRRSIIVAALITVSAVSIGIVLVPVPVWVVPATNVTAFAICAAVSFRAASLNAPGHHRIVWLAHGLASMFFIVVAIPWHDFYDMSSLEVAATLAELLGTSLGLMFIAAAFFLWIYPPSKSRRKRVLDLLAISSAMTTGWIALPFTEDFSSLAVTPEGTSFWHTVVSTCLTFALMCVVTITACILWYAVSSPKLLTAPIVGWALTTATTLAITTQTADLLSDPPNIAVPLLVLGPLATSFTYVLHRSRLPESTRTGPPSIDRIPHAMLAAAAFAAIIQQINAPRLTYVAPTFLAILVAIVIVRNEFTMSDMRNLVTQLHEREDHLRFLSRHDDLTGLDNRLAFRETLAANMDGEAISLHFIDLDGFKGVNDTYGHAAGDAVLVHCADSLRLLFPQAISVARLSGDEFAVATVHKADLASTGERIVESLAEPMTWKNHRIHVTASVGLAVYDPAGETTLTVDEFIDLADHCMYAVKHKGKNGYRVSADEDISTVSARALTPVLGKALDDGVIDVHYQPLVDLQNGGLLGFEALSRWTHEGRNIPPSQFVQLAEQGGRLTDLTNLVLEKVCQQIAEWNLDYPDNGWHVGVNVCAYSLHDAKFADKLVAVLSEHGVHPSQIIIELTETIPIEDLDAARTALESLREAGFMVALDDFGTGYNSLQQLLHLPAGTVKIDRSMVRGIEHAGHHQQLVSSLVDLTQRLDLVVIAEGIELPEQATALRDMGVALAQGYYFGAAHPASYWAPFIEESQIVAGC